MKQFSFSINRIVCILGFVSCLVANANVDLIVKPGENKSVYIDQPKFVNVACLQESPKPDPFIHFTFNVTYADNCTYTALLLSSLKSEDTGSEHSGIKGECDGADLNAKVWGIAVGTQGRFMVKLEDDDCYVLGNQVSRIQQLNSNNASIQVTYKCEPKDKWVKVVVSRYQ